MQENAKKSENVRQSGSSERQPPGPSSKINGGNDAVCFTAGFTGAMFGAGAIHAYLAADREPPAVVAGISAGAINAAAMQRCYQELKSSHSTGDNREVPRWRWFREYLSALTDDPLGVIWRGLPRLTDFSADLPPVQDTSIATLSSDKKTTDFWTDQEKRARRELFLFMRVGDWLSRIPLKINVLATTIVSYVRVTEKIPEWRIWLRLKYSFLKSYVGLVLIIHTAFHPFWFKESRFKTTSKVEIRFYEPSYWLRPLLGWQVYLTASIALLILVEIALGIVLGITLVIPARTATGQLYLARAMESLAAVVLVMVYVQRRPIQRSIWRSLLPLVQSHTRRFLLAAFLAGAEVAMVIFYNHVLDTWHLGGRWLQAWEYPIFLTAFFIAVALLVVFVFEIVVTLATIGQTARTWLDQCKNEALSIFMLVYFARSLLFRGILAVLVLTGGTALLSFLAYKTLPLVRAFAKAHLHPVVAFMLQAPWTSAGAVAQIGCLLLMMFGEYRFLAATGFVALLGLESLAIAARVILLDKPQKRDDGPAVKKTVANRIGRWLSTQVFRNLEMERALVHRFQLLLRLTRLFGRNGQSDFLSEDPMPLVIVAAPLQTIRVGGTKRGISQVWAKPGIRTVDALAAAVALPGLYEPLHFDRDQFPDDANHIKNWEMDDPPRILDLVDGSKIRQNPLPALFEFLKAPAREALAHRLSSTSNDPRIHVVFTVPVGEHEGTIKPGPLGVNIVDVALTSTRLNRRRDSELELEQTNFMSALELALQRYATESPINREGRQKLYPIFADAISPEHDLTFRNGLRPEADEVLRMVASGCRRTLETVYRDELRAFQPEFPEVSCRDFLPTIARNRKLVTNDRRTPGLPEVCGTCACKLRKCAVPATDDETKEDLQRFAHLNGTNPRIVFLASGGVFRGAFHAGMLACLLSADIRPDVIVVGF